MNDEGRGVSDVFISYCREDQPAARKLASVLERQGLAVWWDPHLRVGERYDDAIEAALREAKCVIVLWSAASVSSSYVRDEATYALNRNKLFPVAIENVDPPFRFAGLHTAQLQEWDGEENFSQLLGLLGELAARMGTRPAPVQREKTVHPETGRTKAEWLLHIAAIAALAVFDLGASLTACSRDVLVVLSALIGFPLSGFFIFRKHPYRIAWIAVPILTFLIGMPYGHDSGMITILSFGLEDGEDCQTSAEVPIAFGIVVFVAAVDHFVALRAHRRRAQ